MLTLYASHTSPYARKCRIVLHEKKIDVRLHDVSPWTDDAALRMHNPLGKVPVLVLDDGTSIYDSRVIVEYLDAVSPVSRLIPEPPRQRIAVRRWEALADGVCDAVQAIVVESRRTARQQSKPWAARQRDKVDRGLAEMARDLGDRPWCHGDSYTLADVAVGCALDYLDLRQPGIDWRERHPNLARLAERLGKRPSFVDSAPPAA